MNITKKQLQQIIKEEISIMLEQQSADDLARQAELQADTERAARKAKYGDYYGTQHGAATHESAVKIIDMLTDLTDKVDQLLQRP
jgi:hypothetical protein